MQNSVQFFVDYLLEKEHMHDLRSNVYQQIRLDTTTPLEKARKLFDWLSTQPPAVFWTFQQALRQDNLKSEAVHRCAMSDEEMKELVEVSRRTPLSSEPKLISLRLLSVPDCAAISVMMRCHAADIHAVTISTDLGQSVLTEPKLSAILSALQLCKLMKTLVIDSLGYALTSWQLLTLGAILANLNAATLEHFRLAGSGLGDDGLEKLSTHLQQCTDLKVLTLIKVDLTPRSGTALRKILSCLPRMEFLHLRLNMLGDSGLEQMAEGLKQCKKLIDLHLDSCDLTSRSGSVLREIVSGLPKLETLTLDQLQQAGRHRTGAIGWRTAGLRPPQSSDVALH